MLWTDAEIEYGAVVVVAAAPATAILFIYF